MASAHFLFKNSIHMGIYFSNPPDIVYYASMQRFLNSISILAAVIGIWLTQWLWGVYNGFAHGASKMGDYNFAVLLADGTRMWMSHSDPYSNVIIWYRNIAFGLIAFVLIKLLERGSVLAIAALIPLGLSIFFWILADGIRNIDIDDPDKYIDLLRGTTTQTQVILGLVVFLLVIQLISIFVYFRKHRTKRMENTV